MRKYSLFLLVAVAVLAFSTAAMAVNINVYSNDFGTQDQIDGLSWIIHRGGHEAISGPNPPGDLDTDGLYQGLRQTTSWSWTEGTKAIYAPAFQTMSNITVSGYGAGHVGIAASRAYWEISTDDVTYEHYVETDNSNAWKPYSTSAAYSGVNRVYARTGAKYSSGGGYSAGYSGRTAAFKVDADVNPGQVGDRVNLTRNDFGTQAQRDAWTITGNTSFTDIAASLDHDLDGLVAQVGHVWVSGFHHSSLIMQIDAPAGMAFKDPTATGRGYGSAVSMATYADIYLSTDGATWDVSSTHGTNNGWYDLTADGTGVAGYDDLSTLYVKIRMTAYNNGYLPRFKDLGLTAELVTIPEPATLGLLALGTVGLLRRKTRS